MNPTNRTRADALAIWQAGVDAVRGDVLVRQRLTIRDGALHCNSLAIPLAGIHQLIVVGAGKAGAGMAAGIEQVFATSERADMPRTGWVNVPADCVRPLDNIHLHAARPAGRNEPTAAGVAGARKILELVGSAGPHDLVICLISGGGSALLPLPAEGISWQDKLAVTQLLSDAGASIRQLNTVRKQLSAIKGGGLARACRTRMLTLILSDVIGDPLDVIASGPTVPNRASVEEALDVLDQFIPDRERVPPSVWQYLQDKRQDKRASQSTNKAVPWLHVTNVVLGNNQTAVEAARAHAASLGYRVVVLPTQIDEGTAEEVATRLLLAATNHPPGTCILSGGEPTVRLVDAAQRGKGGRNQQLVLAALVELLDHSGSPSTPGQVHFAGALTLLSGGTDGEDGPTDAAGAVLDPTLFRQVQSDHIDPRPYLLRNDAYTFFARHGALLVTGPTHTNVCDLRGVIVADG
jgi:hydroxypyruvate reductase